MYLGERTWDVMNGVLVLHDHRRLTWTCNECGPSMVAKHGEIVLSGMPTIGVETDGPGLSERLIDQVGQKVIKHRGTHG